jgi:glucose dehydrogenase
VAHEGTRNGHLQAYDQRNGTLVWTSPKLSGGADAPPMVYEANGKEYVAVYAGGNGLVAFAGLKANLGAYLYAFALP